MPRVPIATVVLACLFCAGGKPAVSLPAPTGPFKVGVVQRVFTDSSRPELFTPDPDDFRLVALRIWYPALDPGPSAKPVPYVENPEARKRALPARSPLPPGFFDAAATWRTNSYAAATPADASCPVIVYSHGYGAGMNQATILMEELASRGYCVVSVGHAWETSHFLFEDGSVLAFDPDNEELRALGRERAEGMPAQAAISRATDDLVLDSLIRDLVSLRPRTIRSLHTWVGDISFAIDQLAEMNRSGPFKGRLDLDRVGVIGHSFGGAAAGQACLDDPRCRAGVNLDGLQLGDMLDRNLRRPFMFVHHDNPGAANVYPNRLFFERSEDTACLVLVRGTRHLNFSDLSWPGYATAIAFPAGSLGPIDGLRCLAVQDDCIAAFFDRHLRGKPSELLAGSSPDYPEVIIRARP